MRNARWLADPKSADAFAEALGENGKASRYALNMNKHYKVEMLNAYMCSHASPSYVPTSAREGRVADCRTRVLR